MLQWKRECEAEIATRGLQFHDMGHGWTAEPFGLCSVEGWRADAEVELTDELRQEGMARELINRLQNLRKDSGFEITDHISVVIAPSEHTDAAIAAFADYIQSQVLADTLTVAENDGAEIDFDDFKLNIKIEKI